MASLTKKVTFPSQGLDRRSINGDLRGARNSTMLSLIGNPRGTYDQECRMPTNPTVSGLVVYSADVGPFKVTGLKPAVETLEAIFSDVKRNERSVYDALGHVGMLCCRYVRGSTTAISNHSWGTAVDLTIEGVLDRRGDGKTQIGLLKIYEYFNKHGFFWGAAFGTEDCMHFEASDQLIRQWHSDGRLGDGGVSSDNGYLDLGDRGPEVAELQERLNLVISLDLDVDGIFGPATRAAVMEFQRRNELIVDGVVGRNTKAALGLND